jgi:hypothetical protein
MLREAAIKCELTGTGKEQILTYFSYKLVEGMKIIKFVFEKS